MDFGKLKNIEKVVFQQPEIQLPKQGFQMGESEFKVITACNLWSNTKWKGVIYPNNAKPDSFLNHYGKQFSGIEMNASFYRIFSGDIIEKWCRQIDNKNFRFFPKFFKEITHTHRLRNTANLERLFFDSMQFFGENLGTIFLQLPPDFSTKERSVFHQFVERLPKNFSFSVEWRHPSWWQFSTENEETFALLASKNMGLVCTDTAGRRDLVHSRLTNQQFFLRFVGNDLHSTDYQRIDAWISTLKTLKGKGLREFIWIVHQPNDELNAPKTVEYINQKLKNEVGINDLPAIKLRAQSQQTSLF